MGDAGGQALSLQCRALALDCANQTHIAGILNVTPDSFSDGGRYMRVEDALERAKKMAHAGARIIDVGGASSRPQGTVYGHGAAVVSPKEEMARILPVIEGIAQTLPSTIISVDTYHPDVADAALAAGAHMVNDITGLRYFPEMADVAASYGAALVVMHSVGRPGTMPHKHEHHEVVEEVCASLQAALHIAAAAGVQNVVVDPGFGFGKTGAENLRLINRLDRFHRLETPIMVGISRKSTIGQLLPRNGAAAPVEDRLYGTLGATAIAVMRGAHLVRTHDVKATAELIQVMHATMGAA